MDLSKKHFKYNNIFYYILLYKVYTMTSHLFSDVFFLNTSLNIVVLAFKLTVVLY